MTINPASCSKYLLSRHSKYFSQANLELANDTQVKQSYVFSFFTDETPWLWRVRQIPDCQQRARALDEKAWSTSLRIVFKFHCAPKKRRSFSCKTNQMQRTLSKHCRGQSNPAGQIELNLVTKKHTSNDGYETGSVSHRVRQYVSSQNNYNGAVFIHDHCDARKTRNVTHPVSKRTWRDQSRWNSTKNSQWSHRDLYPCGNK